MSDIAKSIASLFICLLLPVAAVASSPNIVLILSDDHGLDLGSYGNTQVSTPSLDALAEEGMLFEHAFAAQAICTPSRSSIFTGLSPLRHGAHRNHSKIHPGIKTMPAYMQSLGYRVALAGKTHFGPAEQFPFDYLSPRPNTLSTSKTFISKYFESIDEVFNEVDEKPFLLVVSTSYPHSVGGEEGGFPAPSTYAPEEVKVPGYLVDTPQTRDSLAGYYELVTTMDRDVGTVIEMLDRSPAADNTVVIYASDHGSGFAFEKWTNYDAGLQVPMIVRYPDTVPPGSRTDALVSLTDLLPTFVELAGGDAVVGLDGKSFFPVLVNPNEEHRDYIYGTHTTLGIVNATDAFPIRSVRSEQFHYIQNLNPEGVFTNNITEKGQGGWFSWVEKAQSDEFAKQRVNDYQRRPPEEFYDVSRDPFELNNVIGDPQFSEVLSQHRQALEQWRRAQDDQGVNQAGTESILPEMAWLSVKTKIEYWFYKYFGWLLA